MGWEGGCEVRGYPCAEEEELINNELDNLISWPLLVIMSLEAFDHYVRGLCLLGEEQQNKRPHVKNKILSLHNVLC